jgi:hypothetical protein
VFYEPITDRRRPILIDAENAGIGRIDTGPLRWVQQELNKYIDKICNSINTGNQVFETKLVLHNLLEHKFYNGGVWILAPLLVDLLISIDEAGSTARTDKVYKVLSFVADRIAAGEISTDRLYDLVVEECKMKSNEPA